MKPQKPFRVPYIAHPPESDIISDRLAVEKILMLLPWKQQSIPV